MSKGKIWATTESRRALLEKFGVQPSALTYALNFKVDSKKSRDIRRYAVNFLQCAIWLEESNFI